MLSSTKGTGLHWSQAKQVAYATLETESHANQGFICPQADVCMDKVGFVFSYNLQILTVNRIIPKFIKLMVFHKNGWRSYLRFSKYSRIRCFHNRSVIYCNLTPIPLRKSTETSGFVLNQSYKQPVSSFLLNT